MQRVAQMSLTSHMSQMSQAKHVILKQTQEAGFEKELLALKAGKLIAKQSPLLKFSPVLDNGIISVGGRLKHSEIKNFEKNPIVLPKDSHVSLLFTRHYHEQVKHQGRHLTEGTIRAAGLWILGGKRLVNSVIHKCIICRKLRGKQEEQRMADLPPERLKTCPPLSYVGLNVFGSWTVTTSLLPPPGDFLDKDLYTKQWRQVQALTSSGHAGGESTSLHYNKDKNGLYPVETCKLVT